MAYKKKFNFLKYSFLFIFFKKEKKQLPKCSSGRKSHHSVPQPMYSIRGTGGAEKNPENPKIL
jgi:hypothetical protein